MDRGLVSNNCLILRRTVKRREFNTRESCIVLKKRRAHLSRRLYSEFFSSSENSHAEEQRSEDVACLKQTARRRVRVVRASGSRQRVIVAGKSSRFVGRVSRYRERVRCSDAGVRGGGRNADLARGRRVQPGRGGDRTSRPRTSSAFKIQGPLRTEAPADALPRLTRGRNRGS